jgi:hypothetical protein
MKINCFEMHFRVTIGKALPKKAQVIIRHTTHQRADNFRKLAICQFFFKMDKKVHFGRVRSPKSRLKIIFFCTTTKIDY